MTEREETDAWSRGDYDTLILSQVSTVKVVASRVVRRLGRLDAFDDAVSIGMVRVCQVVRKNFDPSRGRLGSLVQCAVRQAIVKELAKQNRFQSFAEIDVSVEYATTVDEIDELETAVLKARLTDKEHAVVLAIIRGDEQQRIAQDAGGYFAMRSARDRAIQKIKRAATSERR